jgi:hypothetical protein
MIRAANEFTNRPMKPKRTA